MDIDDSADSACTQRPRVFDEINLVEPKSRQDRPSKVLRKGRW